MYVNYYIHTHILCAHTYIQGYVRFKSSGCVGGLLESDTKPAGCSFSAVNGNYIKKIASQFFINTKNESIS